MRKLIFLKLGGSLLTDKSKPFTLFKKNIGNIVIEIEETLKEDKTLSLIIGTGTGSFGHYPVQQYSIEEGLKTDRQRYGFCSVHNWVSKLNGIVVEKLLNANIKAFSVHPSSMMTANGGKITHFFYEPIIRIIGMGIIPVIHGDMICDKTNGSIICSVETVFSEFISRLYKQREYQFAMIYAGSTDGVLDLQGNTIPTVTPKSFTRIQSPFFKTEGYDVTGGMKSKVLSCLQIAKYGVKSLIINGTTKGNIKKALLGKEIKGTRIINEESESARLRLKS